MKAINLIGQKFSNLTVLREVPKNERSGTRSNRPQWYCKCNCGKIVKIPGYHLINGNTKSCGCLKIEKAAERMFIIAKTNKSDPYIAVARQTFRHYKLYPELTFEVFMELSQKNCYYCDAPAKLFLDQKIYPGIKFYYNRIYKKDHDLPLAGENIIVCCKNCGKNHRKINKNKETLDNQFINNIIGKVFGRLTVISLDSIKIYKRNKKFRIWKCQCECGNITLATSTKLKNGHKRSCGCLKQEKSSDKLKKINDERAKNRPNPRLIIANNVYKESYNDGDITFEQFLEISQKDCFYCSKPPSNNRVYTTGLNYASREECTFNYNGLDILNHSTDPKIYVHNLDNTVTACRRCNMAKRNLSFNEFIDLITKIHIITAEKRSDIIIELTDTELHDKMRENNFITNFKNGKEVRTNKGIGLYNRYWNYKDNDELTLEKFYYLSTLPCWYCGSEKLNLITYKENNETKQFFYNGLDRKDQKITHLPNNCVPCCRICNMAKTKMSSTEFIDWVEQVYNTISSKL